MQQKSEEEGWWRWLALCQSMKTKEELEQLFSCFLTPEERSALSFRVLLVAALLEGKEPQRAIAERLGVSISKITRGSNALRILTPHFREKLRQHLID